MNAPTFTNAPLDAKTVSRLQAEFALLGFAFVRSTDDRGRTVFMVSRWAMTRQLNSVEEAAQFLRQVGGPNA